MKHENKVVLVTGAGQGMGKAMACRFAREGAKVVAVDVNPDAASATAAQCGNGAIGIGCDVSDSAAVKDAIALAVNTLGRLDVLVNNAGVGSVDQLLDTPDEHWTRVIGVNLTGTFYFCREAARVMQGNGGCIINVSSTAVATGEGPSHYVASKAGVMGLTRSIARELAPLGIRVNTLVPGPTNTPMMAGIPDEWTQAMINAIPLGRMGEPEDIAAVASFLASADAGFVTGQNIAVNGGMAFL
ncbi:SDR family NAD(P)-dependent oxidoreductase [Shewanella sp. GXUN23E]|uniref:SDR family NAD(P)-dependent oxidoreductase n=1 Tax=Shewanella sp. GXUN23E TaxID=3422498 RepID=UPI003D7CCED1